MVIKQPMRCGKMRCGNIRRCGGRRRPTPPGPTVIPVESIEELNINTSGTAGSSTSYQLNYTPIDANDFSNIIIYAGDSTIANCDVGFQSGVCNIGISFISEGETYITGVMNGQSFLNINVNVYTPELFVPENSILITPLRGNARVQFFTSDPEEGNYIQANLDNEGHLNGFEYFGECDNQVFYNFMSEDMVTMLGNMIELSGHTGQLQFNQESWGVIESYFENPEEVSIENVVAELDPITEGGGFIEEYFRVTGLSEENVTVGGTGTIMFYYTPSDANIEGKVSFEFPKGVHVSLSGNYSDGEGYIDIVGDALGEYQGWVRDGFNQYSLFIEVIEDEPEVPSLYINLDASTYDGGDDRYPLYDMMDAGLTELIQTIPDGEGGEVHILPIDDSTNGVHIEIPGYTATEVCPEGGEVEYMVEGSGTIIINGIGTIDVYDGDDPIDHIDMDGRTELSISGGLAGRASSSTYVIINEDNSSCIVMNGAIGDDPSTVCPDIPPEPEEYLVNFSCNNNAYGSISDTNSQYVPAGTSVTYNENTVTIDGYTRTATPNQGYRFENRSDNFDNFVVNQDSQCIANFVEDIPEIELRWGVNPAPVFNYRAINAWFYVDPSNTPLTATIYNSTTGVTIDNATVIAHTFGDHNYYVLLGHPEAGEYTVTVTDNNGHTIETTGVVEPEPDPCDPDSPNYDPCECDPCSDPECFNYDPLICGPCGDDPCSDPECPNYDSCECDPCLDPECPNYDPCECDPCSDPECPEYDPCACDGNCGPTIEMITSDTISDGDNAIFSVYGGDFDSIAFNTDPTGVLDTASATWTEGAGDGWDVTIPTSGPGETTITFFNLENPEITYGDYTITVEESPQQEWTTCDVCGGSGLEEYEYTDRRLCETCGGYGYIQGDAAPQAYIDADHSVVVNYDTSTTNLSDYCSDHPDDWERASIVIPWNEDWGNYPEDGEGNQITHIIPIIGGRGLDVIPDEIPYEGGAGESGSSSRGIILNVYGQCDRIKFQSVYGINPNPDPEEGCEGECVYTETDSGTINGSGVLEVYGLDGWSSPGENHDGGDGAIYLTANDGEVTNSFISMPGYITVIDPEPDPCLEDPCNPECPDYDPCLCDPCSQECPDRDPCACDGDCGEEYETMTCPGCEGSGEMTSSDPCDVCGGTGTIMCATCIGSGTITCPDCNGAGAIITRGGPLPPGGHDGEPDENAGSDAWCTTCGGSGTITCDECGGTGNLGMCESCGGAGVIPNTYLCDQCNGAGEVAICPDCGGEPGNSECPICGGGGYFPLQGA